MSYKQLFQIIPKAIEDLIYEYNPEHRELMKPVLLSILSEPFKCMCCREPIHNNKYRDIGFDFCSVSCYDAIDEKYPDHYYHPYIEVLLYGPDHYDEYFMTSMGYY